MSIQDHMKAPSPTAEVTENRLAAMLAGAGYTRNVKLTFPSGAVFECALRLVPVWKKRDLELATQAELGRRGVELSAATAEIFEHDAILRKLAWAVCVPGSAMQMDTYEGWKTQAPEPLVAALWRAYTDFEHEIDPLGGEPPTVEEIDAVIAGVKKNGPASLAFLTNCGSRTLAHCVTALVARLSNSPTRRSSSGPDSSSVSDGSPRHPGAGGASAR